MGMLPGMPESGSFNARPEIKDIVPYKDQNDRMPKPLEITFEGNIQRPEPPFPQVSKYGTYPPPDFPMPPQDRDIRNIPIPEQPKFNPQQDKPEVRPRKDG